MGHPMTSTDGSDNKITYERWLDEYPNKEKYFSQLNYLVTLPQKPISEPLQAPFYFCKPILFSRYLLHNILFFFFSLESTWFKRMLSDFTRSSCAVGSRRVYTAHGQYRITTLPTLLDQSSHDYCHKRSGSIYVLL